MPRIRTNMPNTKLERPVSTGARVALAVAVVVTGLISFGAFQDGGTGGGLLFGAIALACGLGAAASTETIG